MTPSDAASDPQIAALQAAAEQAQAELEAAQAQAALAAAKVKAAEAAAALAGAGITASGGAPGTAPASAPGQAPTTVVPSEPVAATAEPLATDALPADALTTDTIGPGPLGHDDVERIRAGYAFDGPALEMGALVNGEALPGVQVRIPLAMMNRHGLVAGATGTGKTRTLQVLAEQLSAHGVAGVRRRHQGRPLRHRDRRGRRNDKLLARTAGIGQDWTPDGFPVEYFSLGGVGKGVPIRATIAGFGPILLSKVLGLNDTQESSLGLVFHYADEAGLPLLDLTDLRAVLTYLISDEGKAELKELGGLSSATVGVILRELITFADQGADVFFGEPEIDTAEFLRTDRRRPRRHQPARGARRAGQAGPLLDLPDVAARRPLQRPARGRRPRQAEARVLLRRGAPAVRGRVEGLPRRRSPRPCGSSARRASASSSSRRRPKDVPGDVLAQLGSRVQHQLRAFTPDDAKALRATVSTYPNSGYDLEETLTMLGTGEAIVTVMNEKGAPTPVAWTRLRAPQGLDVADAGCRDRRRRRGIPAARAVRHGPSTASPRARCSRAKLEAANQAAAPRRHARPQAKAEAEYAKQKAAMDKAQAAAQKKADAEYERLLKKTAGHDAPDATSSQTP